METNTEKAIYLNKALPINFYLTLKRQEAINNLFEEFCLFHKKRIKKDMHRSILASIVANFKSKNLLFVSLNKNDYTGTVISFIAVKNIINFLAHKKFIKIHNGFRNIKKQKRTRIESTADFILPYVKEKTINTKDLIILKDSLKEELPVPLNNKVSEIEDFLKKYNSSLSKQYLTIDNEILDAGSLFRVFNQSSLSMGGRFFGGSFQMMPKGRRKKIKINGNKTVECDFSCLHINMLYNLKKLELLDDAYSIDGFDRQSVKFSIMIILNSKNRSIAEKAINFKFIKQKIKAKKLIESIMAKHSQISDLFFDPKIGSKLQFIESSIALKVMDFFLKKGITVLPMHDGFIGEEYHAELLLKTMNRIYKNKMKFNILITK